MREALIQILARAQGALDGKGQSGKPWSREYLLEIMEEIRDVAQDALDEAAGDEDQNEPL